MQRSKFNLDDLAKEHGLLIPNDFNIKRATTAQPKNTEYELHVQIRDWLEKEIGKPGICHKGITWYSVEYYSRGRTPEEMARDKRKGVISGLPDTDFYWPGHAMKIEIKVKTDTKKGKLSDEQKTLHAELIKSGVIVRTAWGFEEYVMIVKEILAYNR